MKQKLEDLAEGTLVLMVKNADNTFSPLGMTRQQSVILDRFMAAASQEEPFVLQSNVKLVITQK